MHVHFHLVTSGEMESPEYRANPVNRCYLFVEHENICLLLLEYGWQNVIRGEIANCNIAPTGCVHRAFAP